MENEISGIVNIDKKKTNSTPLQLHDNVKANKYASPEFTHAEDLKK